MDETRDKVSDLPSAEQKKGSGVDPSSIASCLRSLQNAVEDSKYKNTFMVRFGRVLSTEVDRTGAPPAEGTDRPTHSATPSIIITPEEDSPLAPASLDTAATLPALDEDVEDIFGFYVRNSNGSPMVAPSPMYGPNDSGPLHAGSVVSAGSLGSEEGALNAAGHRASTMSGSKLGTSPTPDDADDETLPIIDIGVMFSSREKCPSGYHLVKKSVEKHKADLNRGAGGRDIYLCYRRLSDAGATDEKSGEVLKPITAVSVYFEDCCEEPPYGFTPITRSVTDYYEADLNSGSGGRRVYLAVRRGEGPYLTDLGVMLAEKKERLPAGFHQLRHTPFGNVADLNSGSDGPPIYLCYKVFPPAVLKMFPGIPALHGVDDDLLARCFACLTASLYSHNQELVIRSLECFSKLHLPATESVRPYLNLYMHRLCDGADIFLAYFNTKGIRLLLKFMLQVYRTYLDVLDVDTVVHVLATNMCLRHEDKKDRISKHMLDILISRVDACQERPCACTQPSRLVRRRNTVMRRPSGTGTGFAPPASSDKQLEISVDRPGLDDTREEMRPEIVEQPSLDEPDGDGHTPLAGTPRSRSPEQSGDEATLCIRCQQRALMQEADVEEYNRATVNCIIKNVVASREIEHHVIRFQRHSHVGPEFRQDLLELVEQYFPNKADQLYVAVTLCLCKFSTEFSVFGLKKSETVKRKQHAASLLLHVLKRSGDFFTGGGVGSAPGLPLTIGEIIFRRFVCTSVIDACVTDVSAIFRVVLQIFILMWTKFRDHLMIELGVMIDTVFIGMLETPACTLAQKKDIIDMLIRIFQEPGSIVNIFYNYDNDSKSWKIYERLIIGLANVIEEDLLKMPTISYDGVNKKDDPGHNPLRRRALRLMVNIMYILAQWIGTPGLKTSRRPSQAVKVDRPDGEEKEAKHRPSTSSKGPAAPYSYSSQSSKATWRDRHNKHKQDDKVLQRAVELAKSENLKTALKFLRAASQHHMLPRVIASFLYKNDGFDKSQVGDILGNDEDSLMTKQEYEKLRQCYLDLLSFTGLSFDAALRLFLCDSGFRLPGESQKVDRLLDVFAQAYCRDNPGVFRTPSSAFIVSFALVMLNTDIHDPRLKSGSSTSRQPMTLDQFIANLRGVDDDHDFPTPFLTQLYQGIKDNAIEWQADKVQEEEEFGPEDLEKQQRKQYELLARKAQALLKNEAGTQRNYMKTKSVAIVKGLFEVSWYRFVAAITTLVDHTRDVQVLSVCLDGLSFGACTAIMLGLDTERSAYTRVLAKVTYTETNVDEGTSKEELHRRLVSGEHLKQDWYNPLSIQAAHYAEGACEELQVIVKETKQTISFQRHQRVLKDIEGDFGNDVHLVDPKRQFHRQEVLTKISTNGKKVDYHFFLFSDLLMYASDGINSKYKMHRVIHLSLIRLVDLPTRKGQRPGCKVVSPQKSITVNFRDEVQKQEWLSALKAAIEDVRKRRRRYMTSQKRNAQRRRNKKEASSEEALDHSQMDLDTDYSLDVSGSDTESDDDGATKNDAEVLRRLSTFLAPRPDADMKEPEYCKLCVRSFSFMRRKNTCSYCRDSICSDCYSQKSAITADEKPMRVCDACYGILTGMVGDNIPIITRE